MGWEMGKDFRIGLMVGLVLALAVLLWVATRPSLNPQARVGPVARLAQADNASPRHGEEADPQSASGRPGRTERGAAAADAQDTPRPPVPVADPGAQGRGSTASGTERVPDSVAGANPPALPDLTIYEKAEKIKTTKFHIVRRGETLSGIARQYYGMPEEWRAILTANQKVIKDPNKLAPGTKLIIPEAERRATSP